MDTKKESFEITVERHIDAACELLDKSNASNDVRAAILASIAQAEAMMLIFDKLSNIEAAINYGVTK